MSLVSSWIGRCYYLDIMLLSCLIIVISGDTLYHGVKVTSVRIMCIFLVNVSTNCWCLLEPSSAFMVIVWDNLVLGNMNFEECFVALRMISVRFPLEKNCILKLVSIGSIMLYLLRVCTLVKVWSPGLVSKHCTPFPFSFVTCLLTTILISDYIYYLQSSLLLVFHYLFAELVHLYI
jgi:hypothetical protein